MKRRASFLSILLVALMMVNLLPLHALAAEGDPPDLSLAGLPDTLVFVEGAPAADREQSFTLALDGADAGQVARLEAAGDDPAFDVSLTAGEGDYLLTVTADADAAAGAGATVTLEARDGLEAVLATFELPVSVRAADLSLTAEPAALAFTAGRTGAGLEKTVALTLAGTDLALAAALEATSDDPMFTAGVAGSGDSYVLTVQADPAIQPDQEADITLDVKNADDRVIKTLVLPVAVSAPAVSLSPGSPSLAFVAGSAGTALERTVPLALDGPDADLVADIVAVSSDDARFTPSVSRAEGAWTLLVTADEAIEGGDEATISLSARLAGGEELAAASLAVSVSAAHVTLAANSTAFTFVEGSTGSFLQQSTALTLSGADAGLVHEIVAEGLPASLFSAQISPEGDSLTLTADGAIAEGDGDTITLEARTASGRVLASLTLAVVVVAPEAPRVTLSQDTLTMYANDLPVTVTAEVEDVNLQPRDIVSVTIAGGDEAVATASDPAGENGQYSFIVYPVAEGALTLTLTAENAADKTQTATLAVTVLPARAAPSFSGGIGQVFPATEDTPATLELGDLVDDPDGVGYALRIADGEGATVNCAASLTGTGLSLTPAANHYTIGAAEYSATVDIELVYTLTGVETVLPATLKFKVAGVEDAPVARDDALEGLASAGLIRVPIEDLLANDTTVELAGLELVSFGPAQHSAAEYGGSLALSDDGTALEYTPDIRYVGTVAIPYTVRNKDGILEDGATLTLTIRRGTNTPPALGGLPAALARDEDEDPDGAGRGTHSLTFTLTDPDIMDWAGADVSVASTNQGILRDEDISLDFVQTDADTRTYTVDLVFQKDANTSVRYGELALVFTARDDEGAEAIEKRVPVTLAPVNDAPTLDVLMDTISPATATLVPNGDNEYTVSLPEDTAASFQFTITDVDLPLDGDGELDLTGYPGYTILCSDTAGKVLPATVTSAAGPQVNGEKTALTYTVTLAPKANANTHQAAFLTSPVVLTLSARDEGGLGAASSEVRVDVSQVNDDPVPKNDTRTINKDDRVFIDVLANDSDVDGDALTIDAVYAPGGAAGETKLGGSVEIMTDPEDGRQKVWYIPPKYTIGTDSFTYRVVDGNGGSATATATITIQYVNHKPLCIGLKDPAAGEYYTMREDQGLENAADRLRISFTVEDDITPAGDISTLAIATTNRNLIQSVVVHKVSDEERMLEIIPARDKNSNGDRRVTIRITLDDRAQEASYDIQLYIEPENDPPKAAAVSLKYTEGGGKLAVSAADIVKHCSDVDTDEGDAIYLSDVSLAGAPANGTLANIQKAPIPGLEEGAQEITGFEYLLPNDYFDKNVAIQYTIRDKAGLTSSGVLTLSAITKNDAPVFRLVAGDPEDPGKKLEITMDEDGNWDVPVFFKDAETAREDLVITISSGNESVVSPGNVRLTFVPDGDGEGMDNFTGGAILTITPRRDQFSTESFDIVIDVSDGDLSVSQTLRLTVEPVPDKPTTPLQELRTMEATQLIFNLLADCVDVDPGDSLKLEGIAFLYGVDDDGATLGSGAMPGELDTANETAVAFTPEAGFVGTLTFSYTVSDSQDGEYTYPARFTTPGYTQYPGIEGGATYDGKTTGVFTVRVGNSSVGPSLKRLPAVTAFAGQELPEYDLESKSVKAGDVYTISAEVQGGGPVDPASIRIDGESLPHTFTAAGENPVHKLAYALKPGVVGNSIIRFTITSSYEGKPQVNTMSFRVSTHAENLPPTIKSPVVLDTVYPEYKPETTSYNQFEIDLIELAEITDPEQQRILFGTLSSSAGDRVRVVTKPDGRQVLEYTVDHQRSARTTSQHLVTVKYSVFDEGGKMGIAVDEAGQPIKNGGENQTYGELKFHIGVENHNPYTYGYITVGKWGADADEGYILLPRTSWDGSAHDTDGDIQYLADAWCLDSDNKDNPGAVQNFDGTDEETIRFKPAGPGWVQIRYRVKSKFRDEGERDWDYSAEAGSVIHVYVPPEDGSPALLPPKATSGWREVREDEDGSTGVVMTDEGYVRQEITTWLFGEGSQLAEPNAFLDIDVTSFDGERSNNQDRYKISDAVAKRTVDENGKYHYWIEYKLVENANSYSDAKGDLTGSLTYPVITFEISNAGDLSVDKPTATGSLTARITSVNDLPVLRHDDAAGKCKVTHTQLEDGQEVERVTEATREQNGDLTASITMERNSVAVIELPITDPDYPTQSKCNAQISPSLLSSNDLVVVSNQSYFVRPDGEGAVWRAYVQGYLPGLTTLTLKAFDESGAATANVATIHVEVVGTNRAPTAEDHYAVFPEDTKAAVKVFYEDGTNDSDPDGDPLEIELVSPEVHEHGRISVEGDKIIFIPKNDFCHGTALAENEGTMARPGDWLDGEDIEIEFQLKDAVEGSNQGVSDVKTLYLHFNPENDPPRFVGVVPSQEVSEVNAAVTEADYEFITVKVYDVDGDADIDFGAAGSVSLQFGADDPVFAKGTGEPAAAELVSHTKNEEDGSYTLQIKVRPNPYLCHEEDEEPSKLTITVADRHGASAQAVVSVPVRPVNDVPVFGDAAYGDPLVVTLAGDTLSIPEDVSLLVDLAAYYQDFDGDTIRISGLSGAAHGSVKNESGKARFTPDKDYFTPADKAGDYAYWGGFDYMVTDGKSDPISGRVYILITPVNDPPVPKARSYTTEEDADSYLIADLFTGTYNAQAPVWDVDNPRGDLSILAVGDGSKTAGVTAPGTTRQGGEVTIRQADGGEDWEIVYVPAPDFNGTDVFFYTVGDGALEATEQITMTVVSEDDPPRANFEHSKNWRPDERIEIGSNPMPDWVFDEDGSQTFSYSVWDPENAPISVTAVPTALSGSYPTNCANLTQLIPSNGGITYQGAGLTRTLTITPAADKYGKFDLVFTLKDGTSDPVTYRLPVTVRPVNDLPVMSPKDETTSEDTPLTGAIAATDKETAAGNLTYRLDPDEPGPARGSVVVNANGSYTYTPTANYFGQDAFYVQVADRGAIDDGTGPGRSTAKVTVNIAPVNDAPSAPTGLQLLDGTHIRGGAAAALRWTGGTDAFNETKRETLVYEAEYSINGGTSWLPLALNGAASTDGGLTWNATLPPAVTSGRNLDAFQVRIRARDDGRSYAHTGAVVETTVAAVQPTLPSGWAQFATMKVDSAPPGVESAIASDGWTNQDVVITLTPDAGSLPGFAPIDSVAVNGSAGYAPVAGPPYTHQVAQNGDYPFRVRDAVGNETLHTVTVSKIDRVLPAAEIETDNAGGKTVEQTPHVILAYEDLSPGAGDAAGDAVSGVATRQYQVVAKDAQPQAGAWLAAPENGRVSFTAKGEYEIYTRTVDNAGNANIQNQGVIRILNARPGADDDTLTLYEHGLDGGRDREKAVQLTARDADGDALSFTLKNDAALALLKTYADVAQGTPGRFTFTHKGGHVPPEHATIQLTYTVSDGTATSEEATLAVTLVRVNDAPTVPANFQLDGGSPKAHYTGGDSLALSWTESTDEETARADLRYELETRVDDGAWSSETLTGTGTKTLQLPSNVSGELSYRVRARDGNSGDVNLDGTTTGNALSAYSPVRTIKLDNTAPTATHTLTPHPTDSSKAILVITPADGEQPWQSGPDEVRPPAGITADAQDPCKFLVPTDGTHTFTILDGVGNTTAYPVDAAAPADPEIAYTTEFTRRGGTIAISWTHATPGCVYELEVYGGAGGGWTTVVAKGAGHTARSYSYTVPNDFPDREDMAFRVRAWDAKGLPSVGWSTGTPITCDSTPPAITLLAEGAADPDDLGYRYAPVAVTCLIQDSPAGMVSLEESHTGVNAPDFGATPRVFSHSTGYTVTANGTLVVRAVDRCGNETRKSLAFTKIDTDAPDVTLTATSRGAPVAEHDQVNHPLDFKIDYADTGVSGLAQRRYAITGAAAPPADGSAAWESTAKDSVTRQRKALGEYYVHTWVRDGAGNEVRKTFGPYEIVNTHPIARNVGVTVAEGGSVAIRLDAFDNDPDDGVADYTIVSQPLYGTLTGSGDSYVYTHDGNDPVRDTSFTYTVRDRRGAVSEEATVTIEVLPVNDPPALSPAAIDEEMYWNGTKEIELSGLDPDDDFSALRFCFSTSDGTILPQDRIWLSTQPDSDPNKGKLTLVVRPAKNRYTPDGEPVVITVTARDAGGLTAQAKIRLTVKPAPLPPTAADQYYFVVSEGRVDSAVRAELGFMGEGLTYRFNTAAVGGYGTFSCENVNGTDDPAFSFEASDQFVVGSRLEVPVTITQKTPAQFPDEVRTIILHFRTEAVTFEDRASDEIVTQVPGLAAPGAGTATITSSDESLLKAKNCRLSVALDGTLELYYAHEPYRYGELTVTVALADGTSMTIPIVIQPVNDPPDVTATGQNRPAVRAGRMAANGGLRASGSRAAGGTTNGDLQASIYTTEQLAGRLTADDSKDCRPCGNSGRYDATYQCDQFGYALIAPPANGDVVLNADGSYTYLPDPGFTGEDLFTVLVSEQVGFNENGNPQDLPDKVADISDGVPLLARTVTIRVQVSEPPPPLPGPGPAGGNDPAPGETGTGPALPGGPLGEGSALWQWGARTDGTPADTAAPEPDGEAGYLPEADADEEQAEELERPPGLQQAEANLALAKARHAWLFLGLLLAALLLLLLLVGCRIRVRLYAVRDGGEERRTYRLFRRIRRPGEEILRLTLSDGELPPEVVRIQIHFGWFHRRAWFYERPLALAWGERECLTRVPDRDGYDEEEKGLGLSPGAFVDRRVRANG